MPVPLRFDPEPPELAFEPTSPADPTLVSVAVTDRVSGLASGQIELSRQGTGTWQSLPTERQGDRLVARIDDSLLPAGVYALRATAWDQASNQNSTDRRANGEPMTLSLPLRAPTVLRAGVRSERTVRRSIKRRGKRRTVKKRVVELRPRAEVRYGERVSITGRLENREGQPVPGAQVQVFAGSATDRGQLVGVVTTDAGGGFSYEALADATPNVAVRLLGQSGDASGGDSGEPVDLGCFDDPGYASPTQERPERPLLRQTSRPAGSTRRQARRTPSRALRPLADVPHDAHPGRRIMGDPLRTSGAPAVCCATGSVPNSRRRPATRSRPASPRRVAVTVRGPRCR